MNTKLFGDTTPINWQELGVRMPFAPMHELAGKYELTQQPHGDLGMLMTLVPEDILRTFETKTITDTQGYHLAQRIAYRAKNTVAALDQATPSTLCINLGGGYHHAGKYPDTGYAYSLINDICWAVDYQLEQNKTIGIIDLDFHFGGGTLEYYQWNEHVFIYDSFHPKGVLQKHMHLEKSLVPDAILTVPHVMDYTADKYILNIGTDWFIDDPLFGKYGHMPAADLIKVWQGTIQQIVDHKIPLAITMGGGYGDVGLSLYSELITWIQQYQPASQP
jgi:acetoin utilization deacetylase AcuC-like enzyme